MLGSWRSRQNELGRRPPWTRTRKSQRNNANSSESFSSEKSRQEARLAGHGRAIVWIREEHALLSGKPLRQNSDMRNGSRRCCDPRRVNQRKSQHLCEYRRIVWMPDVAKRSRGHHAEARGIHDLNVPMLPVRAYGPPTHRVCRQEYGEHRRSEPQNKGTPQKDNLQCRAKQHGSVQKNHPTKFRLIDFRRTPRRHFFLVPLGDSQLY